jgi:hypothetical protein
MFQILASTALAEVVDLLPEPSATTTACTHNSPSIISVGASVPEKHPGMTTTLKHLNSYCVYTSTKIFEGFPVAPTMQSVVIDRVPIADPQLAAIIGDDAETVVTAPADPQSACPADGEVIASDKASPFAIRIAIVHNLHFASHLGFVGIQVLASTTLSEVVDSFDEARPTSTSATRTLS